MDLVRQRLSEVSAALQETTNDVNRRLRVEKMPATLQQITNDVKQDTKPVETPERELKLSEVVAKVLKSDEKPREEKQKEEPNSQVAKAAISHWREVTREDATKGVKICGVKFRNENVFERVPNAFAHSFSAESSQSYQALIGTAKGSEKFISEESDSDDSIEQRLGLAPKEQPVARYFVEVYLCLYLTSSSSEAASSKSQQAEEEKKKPVQKTSATTTPTGDEFLAKLFPERYGANAQKNKEEERKKIDSSAALEADDDFWD